MKTEEKIATMFHWLYTKPVVKIPLSRETAHLVSDSLKENIAIPGLPEPLIPETEPQYIVSVRDVLARKESDKKARGIVQKLLKEEYSVYEKYPGTLVWRLCTEHVDSALLALGIGRREVLRICLGIISDILDMNEVNVQEE